MGLTLIDLLLIPVTYLYILGVIYYITKLRKSEKISGFMARKVIHIAIGGLVILCPILFSVNWLPTLIGVSFILFTFFTCPLSPIPKFKLDVFKTGNSLGVVYYSISLTLLIYFFFDMGWLLQVGFLPVVFGDAFANIIGVKYGKNKILNLEKTLEGTLAAFIVTFIVLIVILSLYHALGLFDYQFSTILLISLSIAVISSIVELISPFGLDNLTIPLFCTIAGLFIEQLIS
ncbi:MAG: hypothetical protein OEY49_09400 [Candidatus Heimdallarchaeota archaeon]|nr:hypothetical protein [Candidatus Heimdallarchaeota archaeon]